MAEYGLLERLGPHDLAFIVRTTTRRRTDYETVERIVRENPDFLETLLDDDALFRRVISDGEILLKISPFLYFTVLIRRAHRDLKQTPFTLEPGPAGRLPVFDAREAAAFLDDPDVQVYLAEALSSFVRTRSYTIYERAARGPRRKRWSFSDLRVFDLLDLADRTPEAARFPVYKRIGDLCLYLTGITPDHVVRHPESGSVRGARALGAGGGRQDQVLMSLSDYEELGSRFYRLASRSEAAARAGYEAILALLADHFPLARKPLNLISEQYIAWLPGTRPAGSPPPDPPAAPA
ncbi:hypothetical protein [Limnochorda pilosa]|uniref:hypothetical protein n=1 Tax=Limnochorda pilosa TaxID=1555112 RepID=UPI00083425A3|nr:hypothetical protein [Limnochorda pilosa]